MPTFLAGNFNQQSRPDSPKFLVCDEGSLVALCMQDYKSLCATIMICATLVNIETHTQTDSILTSWNE